MEETTDERTENVEEAVLVKSLEKDVLVQDIPDVVKEIKDDGDALVMVGAADSPDEVGLKEGTSKDDQSLTAEKVGEVEDTKETEKEKKKEVDDGEMKDDGDEEKEKKEKERREDGEGKKEKKEKKEKDKEEKQKNKGEKKKEKKDKKSKKSDVERIQKKLEKIHAKIDRILAKKEEYLQQLAEAEEKERQEKERLAAEETAKQERDLATATKTSSERNGDGLPGKERDGQEAEFKPVEPSVESSAKQPDGKISNSNTDTSGKEVSILDDKHLEEKLNTFPSEKVQGVKDT